MGFEGSYWEMRGPNGVWGVQVYMIDWMEEMRVVGGGPTLGYGGSQWDTMGFRRSQWDMGVPMGYRGSRWDAGGPNGRWGVLLGNGGSHLDVGCPGLHD